MNNNRVHNFNAGPAVLPFEVLKEAQENLLNLNNSGMSVMEMSHRSKEYMAINDAAIALFKKLFRVPDNYKIMFLQGGASLQFSMVPMNLATPSQSVDLIQTGAWTQKAAKEIKKHCKLNIVASTESENFSRLPDPSELRFDPNAAYVHLCSNNTIFGTQFNSFPDTGAVPLVADMSSDILSRQIDVAKFGLIFAGAQKNLGPSGVTVVIIRDDLVERANKDLPTMLQYRVHIADNSLYNTPPTFGVYLMGLVLKWIENKGGVAAIEKINQEKGKLLYDAIDKSNFYFCPARKQDRSLMNVNFRIMPDGKNGDEALEENFVKQATAAGLVGLKGHRSVGGLRASIYNACGLESVKALTDFMQDFQNKNKK